MTRLQGMLTTPHPNPNTTHRLDAVLGGTVVVGFDGSPPAARALELVAKALAPTAVLVVAAVDPEVHSRGLLAEPLLGTDVDTDALLTAARDRLHDIDPPFRVETIAGNGDPGNELIEIARECDATLIALGGRGHDFEARVLLGSVAAYVAEHAHCDVLVVR